MTDAAIKKALIAAGVKNLKEFGYPGVTADNILTDYIYRAFFKGMLEDETNRKTNQLIKVCEDLLEEINKSDIKDKEIKTKPRKKKAKK